MHSYLLNLLKVKLGEAEIPWGTDKAIFNITGKINRKEWGINWNAVLETGGVLAGEDVLMSCEVLIAKEPWYGKLASFYSIYAFR